MAEEMLMLAVLEQALADLQSPCPAIRADAEAYFLAYKPESSAFSFEAACVQFKLSANAVRAEVRRRITARESARAGRLERAA
jgi:hypothetical protein